LSHSIANAVSPMAARSAATKRAHSISSCTLTWFQPKPSQDGNGGLLRSNADRGSDPQAGESVAGRRLFVSKFKRSPFNTLLALKLLDVLRWARARGALPVRGKGRAHPVR